MVEKIKITIIGGGVVGCAIAYALSKEYKEVCLLEKNSKFGDEQSTRNSGVIHAGVYYPKDTEPLKAKLCVEGNTLLYEFCKEHNVPYKKTGKLIVATNETEEEYLEDLLITSTNNKVPEIKKITAEEAKSMEPNIKLTSAIYVPTSGIIDPAALVKKLVALANSNGAHCLANNKVINIIPTKKGFEIATKLGEKIETFETEVVINAGGLYADEIARMIDQDCVYKIEPTRGEAAKFYKNKREDIRMNGLNVYPAPYGYYNDTGEKAVVSLQEYKKLLKEKKVTRTVGVHLTPTFDFVDGQYIIGNTVTIGPVKTVGITKGDYSLNLKSEESYLSKVQPFFPNIRKEDIHLHQAGIAAVLKGYNDFVIEKDPKFSNFINLIGIDSPGLTSSLAIARYVKEMIR